MPLRFYVYNFNFYNGLYEKNGVYEFLDRDDVRILTQNTFDFFKGIRGYERFDLKSDIDFFNQNEIDHLEDVRVLFRYIFISLYISIFLFLALSLLLLFEKSVLRYLKDICLTLLASSSFILVLILFLYFLGTNFSSLFGNFHLVFFPQGNWQFPEGSLIITIFPFGFFYDFFFKLLISSTIIALVLFITGITGFLISNKKINLTLKG